MSMAEMFGLIALVISGLSTTAETIRRSRGTADTQHLAKSPLYSDAAKTKFSGGYTPRNFRLQTFAVTGPAAPGGV